MHNLEGRFDILVTEICFVNAYVNVLYLNQMIQCLFKNAKHCVVNTLDFKNFQVDSISQTMGIMGYGLENLEKYKMGFGKIQTFSGGESPQTPPLLLHTIEWSLLVDCPPPDKFLKKALPSNECW
jgi:hypothetical protein